MSWKNDNELCEAGFVFIIEGTRYAIIISTSRGTWAWHIFDANNTLLDVSQEVKHSRFINKTRARLIVNRYIKEQKKG